MGIAPFWCSARGAQEPHDPSEDNATETLSQRLGEFRTGTARLLDGSVDLYNRIEQELRVIQDRSRGSPALLPRWERHESRARGEAVRRAGAGRLPGRRRAARRLPGGPRLPGDLGPGPPGHAQGAAGLRPGPEAMVAGASSLRPGAVRAQAD